MDDKSDQKLYRQILDHPKLKVLVSVCKGPIKNTERLKVFKYYYAQDPAYELGKGSFGAVYICFHAEDDLTITRLALKIIKVPSNYAEIKTIENIVSTSRQEIIALIKLKRNENIIRIEDVVRENGVIYIVLEYCNNKDLCSFYGNLVKEGKIKSQKYICYYFNEILKAFKALHQHNFIHRDIKPSNILVKNGTIKVADFGLAKQLFDQCENLQQHVGTLVTAAPQIVLHQDYSNRCDIYSLGVILFWMIYQKYPYPSQPTREDFKQNRIVYGDPIVKISESLKQQLRRMLSYNESDRQQWYELFRLPFFDQERFKNIKQQIQAGYSSVQYRQTYGRRIQDELDDSQQFLETEIPRSIWKYIQVIEGEDKRDDYVMRVSKLQQSPGYMAHTHIKHQYTNYNLKIKFFNMLINQLRNFDSPTKGDQRLKLALLKDLIIYGLQNYVIYLLNRLKDQLIYFSPPQVFKLAELKDAQKHPLHQNFVERVNERVKGFQLFADNKLNKQQIENLKAKCEDFQIIDNVNLLFRKINQNILSDYIDNIKSCIIQLTYLLKPWIEKTYKKEMIEKDSAKYKTIIILIHHLFMFSLHNQIFPKQYNEGFPYDKFLDRQQFRAPEEYQNLQYNIIRLLKRFQ